MICAGLDGKVENFTTQIGVSAGAVARFTLSASLGIAAGPLSW